MRGIGLREGAIEEFFDLGFPATVKTNTPNMFSQSFDNVTRSLTHIALS